MNKPHDDEAAKKQLSDLLERYTVGSVLHLLGELHRVFADDAKASGNDVGHDQLLHIEHALVVVGMGIDAVNPS